MTVTLNTMTAGKLAELLLVKPNLPVAILSPSGEVIHALWEERSLRTQWLAFYSKTSGNGPIWEGDVFLIDTDGPSLAAVER